MIDYFPFAIFTFITLFHIYLGFNGPINLDFILPKINGQRMAYHPLASFPVALLLFLSTISFGYCVQIIPFSPLGIYNTLWLQLTGAALIFRGLFGLIFFHWFRLIIDDTQFKTWDLRIYSPLTIYLGVSSFIALMFH